MCSEPAAPVVVLWVLSIYGAAGGSDVVAGVGVGVARAAVAVGPVLRHQTQCCFAGVLHAGLQLHQPNRCFQYCCGTEPCTGLPAAGGAAALGL